jgi:hypothetical protein
LEAYRINTLKGAQLLRLPARSAITAADFEQDRETFRQLLAREAQRRTERR